MITCFNDATEKRLLECFAHALKLGVLNQLLDQLHYLSNYSMTKDYEDWQPSTVCTLGWDFADYSLSFTVQYSTKPFDEAASAERVWKSQTMCGGLIFHPGRTGRDDSLSVEFPSSDAPHWSVHT